MSRSRLSWPGVGLGLLICACGGGGGDASVAMPAAPAPAPLPDPAPSPEPGTRATCQLADFPSALVTLVNRHRAAGASCGSAGNFAPAGPLRWQSTLAQAALRHSDDMQGGDFFGHAGSDGSNAGQRLTAAGYAWRAWAENIAGGQASVDAVVAGWMDSPGHCANLMNPGFREVGVACVRGGPDNAFLTYWTMDLATPR